MIRSSVEQAEANIKGSGLFAVVNAGGNFLMIRQIRISEANVAQGSSQLRMSEVKVRSALIALPHLPGLRIPLGVELGWSEAAAGGHVQGRLGGLGRKGRRPWRRVPAALWLPALPLTCWRCPAWPGLALPIPSTPLPLLC